jgi:nitrogen fixation protein NifB
MQKTGRFFGIRRQVRDLAQLYFIYTSAAHPVMLIMSDQVRVADVAGRKVQWDAAQMRKIQEHPCFSEKA